MTEQKAIVVPMLGFSEPLELTLYNGAIVLTGEGISAAHRRLCRDDTPPKQLPHVTLLSATEYKFIGRPPLNDIMVKQDYIYVLSPTRTKYNVCWLPVVWNHANVWRHSVGLGKKAFHITVSKEDDHSIDKSVARFVKSSGALEQVIQQAAQIGTAALDHLVVAISDVPFEAIQVAERMVIDFPAVFKGYIRLADATVATDPKLAALSYAQALMIEPMLFNYVSKRIYKLSNQISYGPIVTTCELERISKPLRPLLIRPWPSELQRYLGSIIWKAPSESRERPFVDHCEVVQADQCETLASFLEQ